MQSWSNSHRRASREIQKEQLRARLQTGRGRRVGGALLTDSAIPVTPGGLAGSLRMLLPPDGGIQLEHRGVTSRVKSLSLATGQLRRAAGHAKARSCILFLFSKVNFSAYL